MSGGGEDVGPSVVLFVEPVTVLVIGDVTVELLVSVAVFVVGITVVVLSVALVLAAGVVSV